MRASLQQRPSARAIAAGIAAIVIAGAPLAWRVPEKLASGGATVWVSRSNEPGSAGDRATDVAVSPSGTRVYVVGASNGSGSAPNIETLIAYDRDGSQVWTAQRSDAGLHPSVEVSSDGHRIFVANGHTLSAYRNHDGSPVWSVGGSPGPLISADPGGSGVFAAGILSDCMAVRAFDGMTGNTLWTGSHCFSATSFANAIAVSPQGGHVLVTGEDNSDSGGAYYTGSASFDGDTGDLDWFRGFGKCCSSVGDAIAVSPNGSRTFVSAYDSNEWARIAYRTSDGKLLWHRGGGGAGLDILPAGNRIFIGSDRFSVAAFDASNGERIWHARYVGPGDEESAAMGIAPDGGRVYLTGWSSGRGSGPDLVTVAFGASNGSIRWTSRYNGPANGRDAGNGLAASPVGGQVYVSGASEGVATGTDFVTVAYRSH